MKFLLLCLSLFLCFEAFSKDLYLTVRRDFSVNESPQVELIYRNTAPISIRLLKPNDMKGFIASQIDLRRSWKEPKVVINTAKYLVRGMNDTKIDVDWPRNSVDPELRQQIYEEYQEIRGAEMASDHSTLTEGPPKLINKPDQFKLIKEFSFFPMEEEKTKSFDVPGFNWWFHDGRDGSYKTKFLSLPKLDAGFYVLQVVQGNLEGQVVVVANDIMAYMQQMEDKIIVRASDRNGKAVKGAEVSLRNLNGEWINNITTDSNGEAFLSDVSSKELVVLVEKEGMGSAVIDSEFFSTQAVYPDLYLYSERPLYKPGHEIFFKGILRTKQSGISEIFGLKEVVKVSVKDISDNQIIAEQEMTVNEYGTFSGKFDLPKDLTAGLYRLEAKVVEGLHVGEFRVQDYVKPVLFAKIETKKETLHAGDTLTATLNVGRYSGGVPDKAEFKVELYRTRFTVPQYVEDAGLGESAGPQYGFDNTESVSTNVPMLVSSQDYDSLKNGKAFINIKVPMELPGPPNYDYSFLLKVTVKDADGNFATTTKSFMDMKSEHLVQMKISAIYVTNTEPSKLTAKAVYPSGAAYGATTGKVTLMLEEYGKPFVTVLQQDFKTDGNGKFELTLPSDRVGRLKAIVEMKDKNGAVNSSTAEALVIGDGKSDQIAKVDEVEIYLRKTFFTPKETSKALLLLPEGWGPKGSNQGFLSVTVVGREYFDHYTVPVKGQTAWINQQILSRFGTGVYLLVAYPHPTRGWVERKISYRVLQDDKIMKVAAKPLAESVSPGTEQTISFKVKDHQGNGIQAELAVAVVDEAVLALQPEMRPRLMDFFYPMDRLNAMSFMSTQFQTYGYGEFLAKNFRPSQKYLTTNKIREAIKEKDTAFWDGHVVTNDKGEATVKFRMPANLTKWKVIVSAIDKNGRFGESVADFASKKVFELKLIMPAFIREGDEVMGRLLLSNLYPKEKGSMKAVYALSAGKDLTMSENAKGETTLAPGVDVVQQISFKASAQDHTFKTIPLNLDLNIGDENAKFEYEVNVRPGTERIPVQAANDGTKVSFNLDPSEKISEMKILLSNGLSSVIAPSLSWLVQYPHGCIEQLVNSTVPNLAIASLYKKLKEINMKSKNVAKERMDFTPYSFYDKILKSFRTAQFNFKYEIIPPAPGVKLPADFERILAKSSEFGDIGVARINSSMSPGGDFSWFADMEGSDKVMTMHVLLSLVSVDDPALLKNINLRKIYNNLRSTIPYTATTESIMLAYAGSKLFAWGDTTVESKAVQLPSLKLMADNQMQKGSLFEMSYLLLAMKNYGYKDEGGIDKVISALSDKVNAGLDKVIDANEFVPAEWFPENFYSGRTYYRHLGRETSAVSTAAHALAVWGKDDAKFRKKIAAYLIKNFNGENYGSTYETSHTLVHAQWIFEKEAEDFKEGIPFDFKVNGEVAKEDKVKVRQFPLGWEVMFTPNSFKPGANTIEIDGDVSQIASKAHGLKDVPLEKVVAANPKINLSRKYYLLNEKTGAKTPFDPATTKVRVGDLVYVSLEFNRIETKMSWRNTQYLVVTDNLPPTMQVVQEDRFYEAAPYNLPIRYTRYATRSINSHQIFWYIDMFDNKINPGQIGYVARVANAGTFHTGVAKVADFYEEEYTSHTVSHRLGVDPLQ